MSNFIETQFVKTCNVELPENMKDAYSDPLGLLYFATIVVVARNLVPLAKFAVKIISTKPRNKLEPSDDSNEKADEEASDNEGNGAECPDGESKGGLKKLARGKMVKEGGTAEEEAEEEEADEKEANEETADEKEESKPVTKPDQAGAVFHVLVQLILALSAFVTYWFDTGVNFMDIHLFSTNQPAACRFMYFSSIVMYKPATLSMWMVLMSTSHLCYWKQVKSIPPKEQTNINPGENKRV